MILEKAGISEGLKSRTKVEELNFGRKGSFLRNKRREEREYGTEANVFSDLVDIWLLLS